MVAEENGKIGILLATYNGEKFIGDQIESLLAQTYKSWKLFVRDDGSADGTVGLISKYAAKDNRISIVQDDRKNLGSCQNFATLLDITRDQFEYIMFCDQDDFWLPFKIEETLVIMQTKEKQQEKEIPILVYTNFKYVDDNLKVIEAKKNFQATKVSNLGFAQLLAQNPAYGCTMMINKQLAKTVGHIPIEAENHDYWAALVAGALGKIFYFNKQTILYRQHSNNASTNFDSDSISKRFKRIFLQKKNFDDVRSKLLMASTFKTKYYNFLKHDQKEVLNAFIRLGTDKSFTLFWNNIKNGVRRQTLSQTFLFFATILLLKKKGYKL